MSPDCRIIVDEDLRSPDQSAARAEWASRHLYFSDVGARNWLAVVHEPAYPLRHSGSFGLRNHRLAALTNRRVHTLVSLGPGDGLADLELLQELRRSSPSGSNTALKYIPVDISRGLLEEAIDSFHGHAEIPVGLLCDFESRSTFLARALEHSATPPLLFALLGGTLGNLDRGEHSFLERMRCLMHRDDALLMDVPLAGQGWTPAEEPRLKSLGYTPMFRRFLAEGLRSASDVDGIDDSVTVLQATFDDWATFAHRHDDAIGTEVITVNDRQSGRKVLEFRRYRWQSVLACFEQSGFAVEYARSSMASERDAFGMGVVLLTLR